MMVLPRLHDDSTTEDLQWRELLTFTVFMKITKPNKLYL